MKKIILYTGLLFTISLGILAFIALSDEKVRLAVESHYNPESAYKLAEIYRANGDKERAVSWYKTALNDGYIEASGILWWLYSDPRNNFQDFELAEKYYQIVKENTPPSALDFLRDDFKKWGIEELLD